MSNIIVSSNQTFSTSNGQQFQTRGIAILNDLDQCNQKITQIRDTAFKVPPENVNPMAKRNLAQESYEIAKYTKELINMLDT